MNTLFTLLTAAALATPTSFITSLFYILCCHILVNYFKYNYGNENYWMFSYGLIVFIISWIISFGLYIIFLEREIQ
jgi:hypothetical protein